MHNEVKKLYKNNVFVVLWFLFLAILFISSFLYLGKKGNANRYCTIEQYGTMSDLSQIIDRTEKLINDMENDSSIAAGSITDDLKEDLELYKYLYDNKIEYNDFRMNYELTGFSNIRCVNVDYMTQVMLFFTALIFFIANAIIFNEDYFIGTAKYIFSDKEKKRKIFKNKIILSLIIGLLLTIISTLVIYILSFAYEQSFTHIIYKKENYYFVSASKYLRLTYLYFIIDLVILNILSIGVSLFTKNPFINAFSLGAFLSIYLIIRNNTNMIFFDNLRDAIFNNNEYLVPIVMLIIKILLALAFLVGGIIYFKRKKVYK